AGFGTRLRPLTDELPKPLLPFGDRSLLEHALRTLAAAGLGEEVVVNTHHLPAEFERRRSGFSVPVRLVHEPEIRGTAGGIAGARSLFRAGPVVVATADIVLDAIPPGFRESAEDGGMVMAIAPRPRGDGPVGVGVNGRVVRLRGRTFGAEIEGGEYVGLLALGDRTLAQLPDRGCYVKDYALPLLERGGVLRAFRYTRGFAFPGDDLRGYLEQNLEWLRRRAAGAAYVAPGASVSATVELSDALVGSGARVEGSGMLRRVVVFPGACARGPLENVLVTPALGVVPVP
ncbi:MAG TPA: sugar phosphate nucleotidyltransferase, partial [Polyangiaceae bacterium]